MMQEPLGLRSLLPQALPAGLCPRLLPLLTIHQQVDASQLFMCHDLPGHTDYVTTMEFSDDGSRLVSGGGDATVRLCSLIKAEMVPTRR